MDFPRRVIRSPLFRHHACPLSPRIPNPSFLTQPYAASSYPRQPSSARGYASLRVEKAGATNSDPPQAHPLSGYYYDILSTRSPYRRHATPTSEPESSQESPASEAHTPQEKMAIVFGTRLAGPGRSSRYDPGSAPDATWKTINGVAIPPRPEEPDNCCMSGCVHCVWDDFRDELEDWAFRLEQAKAKGATKSGATDLRHTPRPEVASASGSMDDDGGGSETNWSVPKSGDDLFADIPVGIREFMKTEKKLKQRHQQEGHT
ncbi:oxidoreductase-like domain-containing protein [Aspergillus ibericus CBS 121593]|uniref:Oxidoreductase-like domain-containing protein n=1 Tax=Aspergillus ibericus CBS 121593 TaxID=1448316 RepID=A0A395GRL7_9EURO|nr:hypothetical protein BO80DRAFT_427694 [Aspergillus ibericus CBS 121593]RAK98012.1 hypothetical protein BO80DRAFT_427694 [Aspergillus ibericus CBS 121593]